MVHVESYMSAEISVLVSEYGSSLINQKTDSTYANHLIQENHHLKDNFEILYIERNHHKTNLLGVLETIKHKNVGNLLNDPSDISQSPL